MPDRAIAVSPTLNAQSWGQSNQHFYRTARLGMNREMSVSLMAGPLRRLGNGYNQSEIHDEQTILTR